MIDLRGTDGQLSTDQRGPFEKEASAILKVKPFIIAVAILLFSLATLAITSTYPVAKSGHVDFRHLYTAGYMIRTGEGARLYDHARNEELQNRLVSFAPGGLTFNHLAYETLVFALFSYLSYRQAYLAFLLANLLVLAGTIRMLWPYFSPLADIWRLLPATVVVCFIPVALALAEGQDSLILLALLVAAMIAMDEERQFSAGALLGLTVFKFQYALPIAFLFLVWKHWRFVGGFMACAGTATGLSLWLTGFSSIPQYLKYILSISASYTPAEGTRHGIHPEGMANLRGLATSIMGTTGSGVLLVTILSSLIVIGWASRKRPSLPGAVLAGILVSYHHVISDSSLLVLPLGLLLSRWKPGPRVPQLTLLAGLTFLALPLLLFTGPHLYLLAIPLLVLFALWDGTYLSPYQGDRALACPQKDTK